MATVAADTDVDAPRLARWQERRSQFAHQVGELLGMPFGGSSATTGPALCGVFLAGVGLGYLGQMLEADRRLRDLSVRESHHLASTVPLKVWNRVYVVRWTDLLAAIPAPNRHGGRCIAKASGIREATPRRHKRHRLGRPPGEGKEAVAGLPRHPLCACPGGREDAGPRLGWQQ